MTSKTARPLWTVACVAVVVACGGQSLTHDDGSGGTAGVGGTSGSGGSPGSGGASGSSGSASAGSGQGGSPGAGGGARGGSANLGGTGATGGTGLTGAGRGGAGGAGGSGVGGFAGSVAVGGSGALAGQGGATSDACSLPLETGPCDAAFTRYGFNPKTQRCEPFSYGGCEGNANNFGTFEDCVGACGPANETGCPTAMPANGTQCSSPGHPCDYSGATNCLCQPTALYECLDLVSSCNPQFDRVPPGGGAAGACSDPGCIEEVVIISYMTCTCDSTWTCVVGGILRRAAMSLVEARRLASLTEWFGAWLVSLATLGCASSGERDASGGGSGAPPGGSGGEPSVSGRTGLGGASAAGVGGTGGAGAVVASGGAASGGAGSTGGSSGSAHAGSGAGMLGGGAAGSPSSLRPECPSTAPTTGDECGKIGVECQYGDDPRRACRPMAICTARGWSINGTSAATCPEVVAVDCPGSMAGLGELACEPGAVRDSGPFCVYDDVTCRCDDSTCTATSCAWFCDAAPKEEGCPRARPNVGTPCDLAALACTYTTCFEHRCTGGYWTSVDTGACPMTDVGR